jgi:hypothetical protein
MRLVVLCDEARDVLEKVLSRSPAICRGRIATPTNEILRSNTILLVKVIQQALNNPAHRARRVTLERQRADAMAEKVVQTQLENRLNVVECYLGDTRNQLKQLTADYKALRCDSSQAESYRWYE